MYVTFLFQNMETLQTRVKNMSDDEIRHKYNQLLNKHNSLDEQRMLEIAELHAAIKQKDKDLDELWALVKNAPDVTKSEIAIKENVSPSLFVVNKLMQDRVNYIMHR